MKIKTRSAFYCRQMSDEVLSKLKSKASELNIASWLLVEKILEKEFNIKSKDSDEFINFVGTSKNRAKIGKPNTKKVSR